MRSVCSSLACAAVVVSALAALACLFPSAAAALGLDPGDLLDLRAALEQEGERARQMEREGAAALRRLLAKEAAAGEVVAGTLTPEEAAARFRDLDRTAPECQRRGWRGLTPGDTDAERYRHTVRAFVEQARRGRGAGGDPPPE